MMSAPHKPGSGVDGKRAYATVTYGTVGYASTWANFPARVTSVTPATVRLQGVSPTHDFGECWLPRK